MVIVPAPTISLMVQVNKLIEADSGNLAFFCATLLSLPHGGELIVSMLPGAFQYYLRHFNDYLLRKSNKISFS